MKMNRNLNSGEITIREFAKQVGSTPNKIRDYLREKEVIDINNWPVPGFEYWFDFTPRYRNDLSGDVAAIIKEMINEDGIDYVNNRKVNKANRKGITMLWQIPCK